MEPARHETTREPNVFLGLDGVFVGGPRSAIQRHPSTRSHGHGGDQHAARYVLLGTRRFLALFRVILFFVHPSPHPAFAFEEFRATPVVERISLSKQQKNSIHAMCPFSNFSFNTTTRAMELAIPTPQRTFTPRGTSPAVKKYPQ